MHVFTWGSWMDKTSLRRTKSDKSLVGGTSHMVGGTPRTKEQQKIITTFTQEKWDKQSNARKRASKHASKRASKGYGHTSYPSYEMYLGVTTVLLGL